MSKPAKTPTFESALAELEQIVSDMEAGQLPLEKSIAAYKRGAELLKFSNFYASARSFTNCRRPAAISNSITPSA